MRVSCNLCGHQPFDPPHVLVNHRRRCAYSPRRPRKLGQIELRPADLSWRLPYNLAVQRFYAPPNGQSPMATGMKALREQKHQRHKNGHRDSHKPHKESNPKSRKAEYHFNDVNGDLRNNSHRPPCYRIAGDQDTPILGYPYGPANCVEAGRTLPRLCLAVERQPSSTRGLHCHMARILLTHMALAPLRSG